MDFERIRSVIREKKEEEIYKRIVKKDKEKQNLFI